ncbi:MAG: hypoxanthine phosphoribosyltransferase [Chitinophagaceae bacterium]|nr:MAG: hypoxanthine phosphoribosyltransferase [Chitinophagaceae bacterium]
MQNIQIEDKNFELLLEEEAICKRIRLIGIQINVDYEEKCPVFIGVLNGSFIFMSDLLKEVDISCEIGFVRVSSYDGDKSTGKVREILGMPESLKDRDIIVVEDIVDTGLTLEYLLKKLEKEKPRSVKICTLLYKPAAIKADIEELEYVGFEIPNDFVVGYGLDYNGLGRNLRAIYRYISKPV